MAEQSVNSNQYIVCNNIRMDKSCRQPDAGKGYICDFCQNKKGGKPFKHCFHLIKPENYLRFSENTGREIKYTDVFGKNFFEVCTKFEPDKEREQHDLEFLRIIVELNFFNEALCKKKVELKLVEIKNELEKIDLGNKSLFEENPGYKQRYLEELAKTGLTVPAVSKIEFLENKIERLKKENIVKKSYSREIEIIETKKELKELKDKIETSKTIF